MTDSVFVIASGSCMDHGTISNDQIVWWGSPQIHHSLNKIVGLSVSKLNIASVVVKTLLENLHSPTIL